MRTKTKRDLEFLLRDKYKGLVSKKFLKDAERVRKGEPVDFVIGWAPFLGCHIDLSFRPLIPRPETEFWTEKAIEEIKRWKSAKVLDIFSGSGAIGIAVLAHSPRTKVYFGELESDLVRQIKKNLKLNKTGKGRVQVFHSDIFENIRGRYDFILANPPYIPLARKHRVQKSAIRYEKKSSLFGGKDGLKFIKKLLIGAKDHLGEDGEMWMEFDAPEKKKIEALAGKYGYRSDCRKDQYGRWRYAVLSLKG